MALQEKITQEDLILYEIVKNPVLFVEFFQNIDKLPNDEKFELTQYQKEILCDFGNFVSMCCARAVGKTLSLSSMIVWILVWNLFPEDYVVFTVPNKVHLEPVFTNLIRLFRSNSFLKQFIKSSGGINSGDFTIELLNNAKLLCRIAGQTGSGANVIGLHTPLVILDEAGYYPWGTWIELQPTLNSWTGGHRLIVSGVPTGLRENNVLYHVDQENSSYKKHRVTSYDNPRFTDRDEERAIEQYGGKDSEDFEHFVLGKHSKPVFSLFDRGNFKVETYPVYTLSFNGIDIRNELTAYIEKLSLLPTAKEPVIFGIDLGYTEPTAIVILTMQKDRTLKFHARIRLEKVSYNLQEKILDWLDTKFDPIIMGIDKGSAGISVIQNLNESHEYIGKEYSTKIIPVDFSSWITLGIDSSGNEIKSKTKPFTVSLLQEYSNNHKIIYSSTDLELISELERMTYTKTQTGDIVYKTLTMKGGKRGEDHFTAALLCGVMAYYLNNEYILRKETRKKLAGSSWFIQRDR